MIVDFLYNWCESMRPNAICLALVRKSHDGHISGEAFCHDLIARMDKICYVLNSSDRIPD